MVLSAKAEEKEPLIIEMLNKRGKEKMLYGQDVVKIEVGQTITWTPDSKGHNVQFVSVPEGVEKVKSKLSKEFSYTFEQEGAYLYVCTPHASMGMIGVVINDAIIMLVKLQRELNPTLKKDRTPKAIATIAKTRLRAIFLTTITTVAGVMPTAYGIGGYDAMLSDMMLALVWGLIFGTTITLFLIPAAYDAELSFLSLFKRKKK